MFTLVEIKINWAISRLYNYELAHANDLLLNVIYHVMYSTEDM